MLPPVREPVTLIYSKIFYTLFSWVYAKYSTSFFANCGFSHRSTVTYPGNPFQFWFHLAYSAFPFLRVIFRQTLSSTCNEIAKPCKNGQKLRQIAVSHSWGRITNPMIFVLFVRARTWHDGIDFHEFLCLKNIPKGSELLPSGCFPNTENSFQHFFPFRQKEREHFLSALR